MNVKGDLLDLFRRTLQSLNKASLAPCLRAFILAVLPGLEDVNGEYFEDSMTLFKILREITGPQLFWCDVFLVILDKTQWTLCALLLIQHQLPKWISKAAWEENITKKGIILMHHAIIFALGDQSGLVVRNALEVLVSHAPLHLLYAGPFLEIHVTSLND